jgi:hypothetical protein
MLNQQRVLSTKVLPAPFILLFSMSALEPVPVFPPKMDAAHTQFGPVLCMYMGPNCIWAASRCVWAPPNTNWSHKWAVQEKRNKQYFCTTCNKDLFADLTMCSENCGIVGSNVFFRKLLPALYFFKGQHKGKKWGNHFFFTGKSLCWSQSARNLGVLS